LPKREIEAFRFRGKPISEGTHFLILNRQFGRNEIGPVDPFDRIRMKANKGARLQIFCRKVKVDQRNTGTGEDVIQYDRAILETDWCRARNFGKAM